MARVVILISIIIQAKLIFAQGNLVLNPSFEINIGCPTSNGQFYKVVDWKNPNGGSPEYFDSCGASIVQVPNNYWGSQVPFEGSGYAGLTVYYGTYYEYLQTKLTDSLERNQIYCVSYYVSRSGHYYHASIAPQAYFSNDSISSSTPSRFNYTPQIVDWNIIYDTTNWVLIRGEYQALGGEKYLTLGNFFTAANTPLDSTATNPPSNPGSYYYVDNVSVVLKINAQAGDDRIICKGDSIRLGIETTNEVVYNWTGADWLSDSTISNPMINPSITTTYYLTIADTGYRYCSGNTIDSVTITVQNCEAFNVPTILTGNEIFEITALPQNTALDIFDSRGRLVYTDSNYANDYSVVLMTAGIYYYQLRFPDQSVQRGKFCVIK
jgi:hypothetical protein